MRELWARLKHDFQLSILTLVAVCSVVGVGPYALYRLLEGNWLIGLVDTFLVIGTAVAVLYAWRTGETLRPGQFLAMAYSGVTVLVAIQLGMNGGLLVLHLDPLQLLRRPAASGRARDARSARGRLRL